jgi:hypothetical protein
LLAVSKTGTRRDDYPERASADGMIEVLDINAFLNGDAATLTVYQTGRET